MMLSVRGLKTNAPRVGSALTYEPSVYTKSCEFNLRLCVIVYAMMGVGGGQAGVGVYM